MDKPPVEEEELYSSWALLILTSLLILSLFSSYYLQHKQIRAVHETVLSIFAGMIVGLVIRLSPGSMIQNMVTFKYSYFFNLLLPPIILNTGYEMKKGNFFKNLGTILTFAFAGTFISALVIGILVGIISAIGLSSLSFLDSMIFGSVLSATDPITVLTIFQSLKVDPKLYSIIFGESILNDAVAIVLYETLKKYRGQEFHITNIFRGIFLFFINFGASLAIGVSIGILCALMLKHSRLYKYPSIESCLIALMAYSSYLFSNGLHLSGIVSLLFCGITLKHYTYDNMSLRTKRTTRYMFHVLAKLSENFIFIYLGLALFTESNLEYKPLFIFFTAIIICVSRYSAVFPLSKLINTISRYRNKANKGEPIPHKYSVMLFWAGLRGAVAFALAAGLEGENADAMRTTILVVVVLSVIVFGGSTSRVLEIMKIQTGVDEGDDDSDDDDDRYHPDEYNDEIYEEEYLDNAGRNNSGHNRTDSQGSLMSNSGDTSRNPEVIVQSPRTNMSTTGNNNLKKHWFTSFDDRYLKPLFTRNDKDFRQLNHRSSNNRWDHERRHEENNEDFVGLIRGSSPLRNSIINNKNSTSSNVNNRNNQRIEFTNNKNKNNTKDSSSSTQQQSLDNPPNSGFQSFPDLNNLLIDDVQDGNLLDLKEFSSNNK
ncbi:Sodium/hydrogen exchanger family-domain-containing protein [Glomus cerebriforme]|uniref:Sodium/hydrogen exchanger n=1 Tax=Glomus cerebriforme TaxID=658196 RepID=A0A397TBG5_9GLOM|nr:Sodium/hydrogen exchanger family-domain-containing protein [Glomus cerebriforme]